MKQLERRLLSIGVFCCAVGGIRKTVKTGLTLATVKVRYVTQIRLSCLFRAIAPPVKLNWWLLQDALRA
jgi:hypothetical protein